MQAAGKQATIKWEKAGELYAVYQEPGKQKHNLVMKWLKDC